MNYLLVGLLVLVTGDLLLDRRWAWAAWAAMLMVSVASSQRPPPDSVVTTLAGHPLRDRYGDGPKLTAWFSRVNALGLDGHDNL
jgi:hypothetical protein